LKTDVGATNTNIQALTDMITPVGVQLASVATDVKQIRNVAEDNRVAVDAVSRKLDEVSVCTSSVATQDGNRDILSVVEETRLTLSGMDKTLSSIPCEMRLVSNEAALAREAAENTYRAFEQGRSANKEKQLQLEDVVSRLEEIALSLRATRAAPPTGSQVCVRMAQKPSYLRDLLDGLEDSAISGDMPLAVTHRGSTRLCDCIMAKRRNAIVKGPFWAYAENQQPHLRNCKYFARPTWTFKGGALLPVKILSSALRLSFAATKGAGGFSLSPNFAITRLIDRGASPAFALFDTILRDYSKAEPWSDHGHRRYYEPLDDYHIKYTPLRWDMVGLERHLYHVLGELEKLFEGGKASPLDTDAEGRTLLHEVAVVSGIIESPSPRVLALIKGLVGLLIEYGVVRDAKWGGGEEIANADAMDIAITSTADSVFRQEINPPPHPQVVHIDEILSRNGCELFGLKRPRAGTRLMRLAIGYGPVARAVVDHSLDRLEALLRSGHDPNENSESTELHPPLCLALKWLQGFELLLQGGADPLLAVGEAFGYRQYEAIKLLLEYDCPLSQKMHYSGVTALDLIDPCHLEERIADLVIAKAAGQRRGLWALATRNLSELEIGELGIQLREGEILDAGRVIAQEALIRKGVDVPPAFRVAVGKGFTIYHSEPHMSLGLAQKFFDIGFWDVDRHDPLVSYPYMGLTPFLWCCYRQFFDSANWFLGRGARTRVSLEGILLVAQHLLASGLAQQQPRYKFSLGLLQRIKSQNGPFELDGCVCYCSPNGCTAITHLLNRPDYTWVKKILILRKWLNWCQFSAVEASVAWKAFCRMEIFARLGMAHTCCRYIERHDAIRVLADEQTELRDEDMKSGLVEELEHWVGEYNRQEMLHQDKSNQLLVMWWSNLNRVLDINETHKGHHEKIQQHWSHSRFPYDPKTYFDCDEDAFSMTLEELEQKAYRYITMD
ncbi:hypothetical protein FGG08_006929, partial [Glutinoglossum americanum]